MIARKPRGAIDPVDDLLGFGKPKKAGAQEPKPVVKQEVYTPGKMDRFIDEVKETNRVVNRYKGKW